MGRIEGLFDGLGEAKINKPAIYIGEGKYIVRCDKCKADKNRKRIPYFACEMTVIHRVSPPEESVHKVGAEVSNVVNANSDYFLSDIKQMIHAFSGLPEEDITKEMGYEVCEEEQILAGMLCYYSGVTVEGKEPDAEGKPKLFTKRLFRPITFKEASDLLTDAEKERFFPGTDWEELIKAEQGEQE